MFKYFSIDDFGYFLIISLEGHSNPILFKKLFVTLQRISPMPFIFIRFIMGPPL